jgi:NitT/TauT family transport system substrate-binding protein
MRGRIMSRLWSLVAVTAVLGAAACAPQAAAPTAAPAAKATEAPKPAAAPTTAPAAAPTTAAAAKPTEAAPAKPPAAPTTVPAPQPAAQLEKVSVRLNWLTDAGVVPHYLAALKKGYYAEEGLDVEIIKGNGSADTVKLIGAGENTFGQADAVSILQARAAEVPVVAVMAVDEQNPFVILANAKSGIRKLEDLPGKTAGVIPASAPTAIYRALLKQHNIDASTIREVTVPPPGYAQVAQGQVDFLNTFDNATPIVLAMAGGDINVIYGRDLGLDLYGVMVLVHENTIKQKPETITGFLKATKRGMDFARQNHEETAELLVQTYPELNKQVQIEILKTWTPYWIKGDAAISMDRMKKTHDLFVEQGIIPKSVDLNAAFTNQFVPR